jgi:hypothetical protein
MRPVVPGNWWEPGKQPLLSDSSPSSDSYPSSGSYLSSDCPPEHSAVAPAAAAEAQSALHRGRIAPKPSKPRPGPHTRIEYCRNIAYRTPSHAISRIRHARYRESSRQISRISGNQRLPGFFLMMRRTNRRHRRDRPTPLFDPSTLFLRKRQSLTSRSWHQHHKEEECRSDEDCRQGRPRQMHQA